MNGLNLAQPDVTLYLTMDGVIEEVAVSTSLPDVDVESWRGRPWIETVGDIGSDKVKRMLEDARTKGVSAFRQLNQQFPGGLELPMEYTAVRLGEKGGLMAIGRNLQAVAELQTRLIAAQQVMERDYWKLREVESRYRLLFDSSNEAVLLIRASNLHIVEANPAAIRALGVSPIGRNIVDELASEERRPFEDMLQRLREQGRAPGLMVRLGQNQEPWVVQASLMTSGPSPMFLIQLSPVGVGQSETADKTAISFESLVERMPDAFVVLDDKGVVRRANRAFLDLVQVGVETSVIGERLGKWLWRPGADLTVLLANIQRHGVVRLFATTIHGELGTDSEVELSATGKAGSDPRLIAVMMRDVGRRLVTTDDDHKIQVQLGSFSEQIGNNSLRGFVKDAVEVVERHYIEAALDLTNGNRTAAAELLGVSRQSLYAKLNRYGLDSGSNAEFDKTA